MRHKLLLATNNQAKVHEYKSLLSNLPFELVTLAEQGITTVVKETGKSLEENAILKATTLSTESQLLTLSDDSGLEVDALDGKPGRLSARFAGENASDRDRVSYLLSLLEDVPRQKRSARFRCIIAVAAPDGDIELCSGECQGYITLEPKGKDGFGYDPIFYLPELDKTMAELPLEIKNQVSHRGHAARKVYKVLDRLNYNK